MATAKRVLENLGDIGKTLFGSITRDNIPYEEGGGLSSLLIKKTLNGKGVAGATFMMFGYNSLKGGFEGHNAKTIGRVSYSGMTRMTNSYTTGAVEAMHRISNGNYETFAGMAEEVVKSPGISRLDDFGANSAMISALYNMKGR